MKRYYSERSSFSKCILISSVIITWVATSPIFMGEVDVLFFVMTIFASVFTIFIASIYHNTYYYFEDENLVWVTGPIRGKIKISEIRRIEKAKSVWDISSAIKPILSQRPLLLYYSKYDELPVSPKEELEFIHTLVTANPEIELNLDLANASDQLVI